MKYLKYLIFALLSIDANAVCTLSNCAASEAAQVIANGYLATIAAGGGGGGSSNIATWAGVAVDLGAGTTGAGTLRVVLPTNQAPLAVTGTFWQATQPVSGTFWQATQPVSLASLPTLPAGTNVIGHVIVDTAPTTTITGAVTANLGTIAGAATAAKQPALGIAGTPSTDVITIQGISGGTNVNVNCASGCSGGGSSNIVTWNGVTVDLGAGTTGAGTLRVVLPTDQSALSITSSDITNISSAVTAPSIVSPAPSAISVQGFPGGSAYPISVRAEHSDGGDLANLSLLSDWRNNWTNSGGNPVIAAGVFLQGIPDSNGDPVDIATGTGSVNTGTIRVTIGTDQPAVAVTAAAGTPTNHSGTIASGGTAQSLMSANPARKKYRIQNQDTTEVLCFNDDGGTAVLNGGDSYCISPGGSAIAGGYYESESQAAISIIAATTGHKFSASEY